MLKIIIKLLKVLAITIFSGLALNLFGFNTATYIAISPYCMQVLWALAILPELKKTKIEEIPKILWSVVIILIPILGGWFFLYLHEENTN